MDSEIRKGYGGFRLVNAALTAPTIKYLGNLTFACDLNLPIKDRNNRYTVDVYYNDRFVQSTNVFPIALTNETLVKLYNNYTYMPFTFITRRIIGNKTKSDPTTICIQKTKCANGLFCSERLNCSDKDEVVEEEEDV